MRLAPYLSRLRERSTRSESAAGEGSLLLGTFMSPAQSQRGGTPTQTLPRKRKREPTADAAQAPHLSPKPILFGLNRGSFPGK
ncbi:hypothetical protein ACVIW2_004822 [Bradyrhizobium huanghuaihaiense]|uniref:Uncharacterized protein n=1 Tax=Bradyrhizobium huanghuaihaiense TaxID=990078 RepID=A0A562R5C4_9BRAD|nr:hypothetical protein IQ16_05926 [Bradyrhizobium huanghuaihaiense]